VAESYLRGAVVSEVARQHDISRIRPVALSITHNFGCSPGDGFGMKLESFESLVIHC
jgi:hypothetical protein